MARHARRLIPAGARGSAVQRGAHHATRRLTRRASFGVATADYEVAGDKGQDRNKYDLIDGTNGDVYRCILLALKQDPGRLTYSYDQMLQLVRDVCQGNKHPPGSSISEALEQIDRIAVATSPSAQILEWDRHSLDIVEPYFMFFLRKSMKLASLAE